jgi:KRAB domain-containing zinc finger protein
VKEEIVSDCEYEFEFSIDDTEYDEVLKELRAKDSDLEEIGEIVLSCPYEDCNRTFTRKYNLSRHLRSHEIPSLDLQTGHICHICGKNIKGVYSLHLKIHENLKGFKCNECGREFRQKIALTNHLLIHRNEKPHECQWYVVVSFLTLALVCNILRKLYSLCRCFKRFRQKYSLKYHVKRHTGVKEFICGNISDRNACTLNHHTLLFYF